MKTCSKCKLEKDLSDFYKKTASKDGYRSECKICNNILSRKYKREYYHKNKENINKDSIGKYLKEYKEKNKDKINSWRKNYREDKFKNDSVYKLTHNIRGLISAYLRKFGYTKSKKTELILGCSFEEFKTHIESQFQEGMSWENQGRWHLDHKTPISWAETEEQVYELNHYTNFQPLWAEDNLSKGNKWSD